MKTRFGKHIDDHDNPLQELIDNAKQIPYIAAQIVLRDSYERMYGIFDHQALGAVRPLALVAKHPAEDVHSNTRAYNTVRRFMENDIGSQIHTSLEEFLNLPREYTKLIMDLSTERRNRKNATAADIERRLKEELNGKDRS